VNKGKKKLPKSKVKKVQGGKKDPKVTRSCCSFARPGGVVQ